VTVVENAAGTVTMSKGIVAIALYKDSNELNYIRYTFYQRRRVPHG
jgi:hypothetical protein